MESSLHNGPVYFNCFPDLPLSLRDKNILKTLTLNIQTAEQLPICSKEVTQLL